MKIGHDLISSTIKNQLIVLDETRLSHLLKMPKEGRCYLILEKKIDGLRIVLERRDVRYIKNL